MQRLRKRRRSGQGLLEVTLVIGAVLVLIVGILIFGQLFSWLHTLNNAAREGARLGALCKPDEEIIATIREMTERLPNAESITITIDPSGVRRHGDPITVTISYDAPFVPIAGISSGLKRLVVQATYTMECPPEGGESEGEREETKDGATCDLTCAGSPTCDVTCPGQLTCSQTCEGLSTCS